MRALIATRSGAIAIVVMFVFALTGAGDTIIATLAADFERGWSLPDACAAAIQTTSGQVQTIGIRQVPLAEPFTPALTKACEAMGIHGEDGLGGRERV